jgi:hypothetical protein
MRGALCVALRGVSTCMWRGGALVVRWVFRMDGGIARGSRVVYLL